MATTAAIAAVAVAAATVAATMSTALATTVFGECRQGVGQKQGSDQRSQSDVLEVLHEKSPEM
ncbi:hypothetical protein [Rhodoferax sp.]|uniref:hypothetical protein n=1 Tax=Rhodoferax sp. TaxID=50421 RepID=UPI002630697A|nr:hypothetical protein [Rhodoferax sp.]MDD2926349.1 hypothetical protein [Rhodoferax sp.]